MKKPQEYDMGKGFKYLVDTSDENQWNNLVTLFRDATVNQTWAYCNIRSSRTSNLVLIQDGRVQAAAMLRLRIIPVAGRGIAYLGSGPMWRLRDEADDLETLRMILCALKAEYVVRRGLFLRILPNMFTNLPNHGDIRSVFKEEGFCCRMEPSQTLFLDLTPSVEDLRKGLHPKWRNHLNHAEKSGLMVREGVDNECFKVFMKLYEAMLARKQYETNVDINEYEAIQRALPASLKPTIVISELEGRPQAGGVFSTIGTSGVSLLGATGDEGIKNGAAYLVQWHLIRLLKVRGFNYYDLGGCSAKAVPSTYHFKARICGKAPILYDRIGTMEACMSLASRCVVRFGDRISERSQGLKRK